MCGHPDLTQATSPSSRPTGSSPHWRQKVVQSRLLFKVTVENPNIPKRFCGSPFQFLKGFPPKTNSPSCLVCFLGGTPFETHTQPKKTFGGYTKKPTHGFPMDCSWDARQRTPRRASRRASPSGGSSHLAPADRRIPPPSKRWGRHKSSKPGRQMVYRTTQNP